MGLDRVLGQDKQVEYLRKLLEKRNIPSTLLFVGPKGVGKFFTAVQFAKALNCKAEPFNGCDKCKSCIAIDNKLHPNLKIINGDTIGIDDVRSVINSSFVPIYGYRVNIFVDVENATIQAFNSMLKYLEEPPKNTLNILIAESDEHLPQTIVSRSVVVRFNKLPLNVVEEIISTKIEDEDRRGTVAHILNGSLENFPRLIDEETYKKRKRLLTSFLMLLKKEETTTTLLNRFKDYYGDFTFDSCRNFIDELLDLMEDIVFIVVKKDTDMVKNIDLLGFIADEFLTYNMKKVYEYSKLFAEKKEALFSNANQFNIILSALFTIEYA